MVNESLPILSPTLFLSEKARPLSSINPDEPIKVKILLTPLADEELGFQTILKSVADSPEDLPLQTSKIIHNTIPRGEDSILQFLRLSKDHSDIKKIDLVSPTAPVEDAPIILLKTLNSDDIQEMSDKHVKMASFVTRAMDIAVSVLSQIGMIAIIIYTSRAKLAQSYAKFGESARITLANASHLSGRTATETTRPGGSAAPASGVTHSDSQDSEYTLGSDSSDGLPLTAAAGLGGGIVSAAVGHSIARAENEYAAAMEAAFEDLVDDVVVLAAAAA